MPVLPPDRPEPFDPPTVAPPHRYAEPPGVAPAGPALAPTPQGWRAAPTAPRPPVGPPPRRRFELFGPPAFPRDARPAPVLALAVLLLAGALTSVATGVALLAADDVGAGDDDANRGDDGAGAGTGFLLVLLAAGLALAAWGLVAAQRWAWWAAFGAAVVGALVALAGIFEGYALVGVIALALAGVAVGLLFNRDVVEAFRLHFAGLSGAPRRG